MKKYWEIKQLANPKHAEIYIYGDIVSEKYDETDVTSLGFHQELKALGDVEKIDLHINSFGGSVFEGIAIGNMLKQHAATVTAHVDALAASIATVIVASCNHIIMHENSMLMIHNPSMPCWGSSADMRKAADDLDRMAESSVITYVAKSNGKLTEEKIRQIMDEETWLSAKEAQEIGLCDEIIAANQMVACADSKLKDQFKKIPKQIGEATVVNKLSDEARQLIIDEAKQNNALVGTILGGI